MRISIKNIFEEVNALKKMGFKSFDSCKIAYILPTDQIAIPKDKEDVFNTLKQIDIHYLTTLILTNPDYQSLHWWHSNLPISFKFINTLISHYFTKGIKKNNSYYKIFKNIAFNSLLPLHLKKFEEILETQTIDTDNEELYKVLWLLIFTSNDPLGEPSRLLEKIYQSQSAINPIIKKLQNELIKYKHINQNPTEISLANFYKTKPFLPANIILKCIEQGNVDALKKIPKNKIPKTLTTWTEYVFKYIEKHGKDETQSQTITSLLSWAIDKEPIPSKARVNDFLSNDFINRVKIFSILNKKYPHVRAHTWLVQHPKISQTKWSSHSKEIFPFYSTLKDLVHQYYPNPSKNIIKIVGQNLILQNNLVSTKILLVMKEIHNSNLNNLDLTYQLANNLNKNEYFVPFKNLIKVLRKIYPLKRVIKLIKDEDSELFNETTFVVTHILSQDSSWKSFFPKKPKSLKDIYNVASVISSQINQTNFFIQQDLILPLHKKPFKNFTIKIAQSRKELIMIGNQLQICIGNGYYASSASIGDKFILYLVNKDNHPIYCVEISTEYPYNIIQFKGFKNQVAPPLLVEDFKTLLSDFFFQYRFYTGRI